MRTLVCTAALLVFFIVNLQGSEAAPDWSLQCGGFQTSCKDFKLHTNGVFSAKCTTTSDTLVSTSINLDDYISNDNGQLVTGSGGFTNSCDNERVSDGNNDAVFISADCKKSDGTLVSTNYDISNNVSNNNGVLTFDDC